MGRFSVFTDDYGLEKQSHFGKNTFAGLIQGYYTIVTVEESRYKRDLYITVGATVGNSELQDTAWELQQNKNMQRVTVRDHTIEIQGITYVLAKPFKEFIHQIFDTLMDRLIELEAPTGCFLTGVDDGTVELIKLEGEYAYVSNQAFQETEAQFQAMHSNGKRQSLVLGLLGALIGSIVGGLIWGVLLYFGYYGWFAAIIGVILAFYLYRKFGGPVNIVGAVGILIVLISTLLVSNRLVYTYIISTGFNESSMTFNDFSEVFMNLESYLADLDSYLFRSGQSGSFVGSFNTDNWLGIGVAMIFGTIYFVFEYNRSKNQHTIKRIK